MKTNKLFRLVLLIAFMVINNMLVFALRQDTLRSCIEYFRENQNILWEL